MSDRTWHKGPPPHIGWWNASTVRNPDYWRWWDGKRWCIGSRYSLSAYGAAGKATVKDRFPSDIEWSDYYPDNARVPRIDPRKAASLTNEQVICKVHEWAVKDLGRILADSGREPRNILVSISFELRRTS